MDEPGRVQRMALLLGMELGPGTRGRQPLTKSIGNDREAVGLTYAERRQLSIHLAERGIFATDQRDILVADL